MPELIPAPPPPEKTQAERIAEAIIAESNRHFPQRLDMFKNLWSLLWENATATGTTAEALLGSDKYLNPALPVTFHPDGTVTLQ